MTSTFQLALQARGKHSELVGAWLKYNNDVGYSVHTSQNAKSPQARYFSVCYSSPTKLKERSHDHCQAHLKAVGDTRDSMEIISLDLNHTCCRTVKRKRQYKTSEIANVSETIDHYQPARAGSAKQFVNMTKASTGVSLCWNTTPEIQIRKSTKKL